jgi:hypothetical protein
MRQAKIRVGLDQGIGLLHRQVKPVGLDGVEYLCQQGFGPESV